MKKILLISGALLISLALMGQHSQGSFMIEGGVNFYQSQSETIEGSITEQGPTETGFSFSPSVGYFITPNMAAGIGFSYSSDKTDITNEELTDNTGQLITTYDEEITSNLITIGPYFRYYIMPFERSGMFLEASFLYGFGDGSDLTVFENPVNSIAGVISSYETTQDITLITTGISPGLVFYISPKLALQASFGFLGYSKINQENFDDLFDETIEEEVSEFDISFNASTLSFGVSFVF